MHPYTYSSVSRVIVLYLTFFIKLWGCSQWKVCHCQIQTALTKRVFWLSSIYLNMAAFWDISPCSLVEVDSSPWWWRQYASMNHRSTSTRLRDNFILAEMCTLIPEISRSKIFFIIQNVTCKRAAQKTSVGRSGPRVESHCFRVRTVVHFYFFFSDIRYEIVSYKTTQKLVSCHLNAIVSAGNTHLL
jgi:hypothetical protein